MRALLVGTGNISINHAMALRQQGHVLMGVVGHTLEKARDFAQRYGCPSFDDHLTPQLLSQADAVHICTPPGDHFPFAKAALEAGKAVFCEKPLTFSVEEAEELCRLAREQDVLAAVNFNNRFYPAVSRLKGQLTAPVELVQGRYRQEFHCLPAPYSWRYTDPYRAVSEIGSHFVDLMRYLTGKEVETVSALFYNAGTVRQVDENGMLVAQGGLREVEVTNEDAATALFRFAGGGIGSAFLSEICQGRSNDLSIELTTAEGCCGFSAEDPYAITIGKKGQGVATVRSAFDGGFSTTFCDALAAFYESLASGKPDPRLATFADGLAAVKLCQAMKRSAEAGGAPVHVT